MVSSDTLLVLIHGGGWVGGDKIARNFDDGLIVNYVSCRYGMNVASINYTLATSDEPTAPVKGSPYVLDNIHVAIEVIKERTWAKRVVVLGTSAGANLGYLAAIRYPDLINGFIGFYGVYDLRETVDFQANVADMIAQYTGNETERLEGGSPIEYPRPHTPYVLYHGDSDVVVNARQSEIMRSSMIEVNILPGYDHAFKPFGERDNPAPWVERMVRYIHCGE